MLEIRQTAAAALLACCALLLPVAASAQGGFGAAERGKAIAGQWCSECHATGAAPQAADVAPSFHEIAETRSPDYLRGFLANPHVRGQMPPFELSSEHVEDLVAYLETLR